MILMTQKKRVTSGTLLSMRRRKDGEEMAVMGAMVAATTLRLPDRRAHRRQLEHEAAAGPGAGDDVPAAGARQPARERQAEPGAAAAVAPARLERVLAQAGGEAGAVVAHGEPHA